MGSSGTASLGQKIDPLGILPFSASITKSRTMSVWFVPIGIGGYVLGGAILRVCFTLAGRANDSSLITPQFRHLTDIVTLSSFKLFSFLQIGQVNDFKSFMTELLLCVTKFSPF